MPENQYLNFINYQRAEPLNAHIGKNPVAAFVATFILFEWERSEITFKDEKACCPTQHEIACAIGISIATVRRKTAKLVELGLIHTKLGRWVIGSMRLYFKVTDLFLSLVLETGL